MKKSLTKTDISVLNLANTGSLSISNLTNKRMFASCLKLSTKGLIVGKRTSHRSNGYTYQKRWISSKQWLTFTGAISATGLDHLTKEMLS